jgi:hypothetical protein
MINTRDGQTGRLCLQGLVVEWMQARSRFCQSGARPKVTAGPRGRCEEESDDREAGTANVRGKGDPHEESATHLPPAAAHNHRDITNRPAAPSPPPPGCIPGQMPTLPSSTTHFSRPSSVTTACTAVPRVASTLAPNLACALRSAP